MKILIDMNLSPSWVEFFADSGIDLDFGAMLVRRCGSLPSVIQIRTADVLPAAMGPTVLQAITASRDHLATRALVTVDVRRCRVRMLPIGPSA